MLAPSGTLEDMPVLPHSHERRYPVLTFTRAQGEQRLVLRLWRSGYVASPSGQPIWIGAVTAEQLRRNALWRYPSTSDQHKGALRELTAALRAAGMELQLVDDNLLLAAETRNAG
jgi:hypothetical protein